MVNCDKNSEYSKNSDYICDYDTGKWIKKKPCNENNPKANDGQHICNEKTGYWVKKDGKIGMKILLEQVPDAKTSSPPVVKKHEHACGLNIPNLTVIDIPKDGNCFYNSIATALDSTIKDVRQKFADAVTLEFINNVNATKANEKYTVQTYKKTLLKNNNWVPDSAIPLFPKAYKDGSLGLIILNQNTTNGTCTVTCYDTLLENKGAYIILLFSGGNHYDLIQIGKNKVIQKKNLPAPIVDKIKQCKNIVFSSSGQMELSKKAKIDIKINGNLVDIGIYDKFTNLVDDYGYTFIDTYKGVYEIKNIDDKWPQFLTRAKKVLGKYYNGSSIVDGKNVQEIDPSQQTGNNLNQVNFKNNLDQVNFKNNLEFKFTKQVPPDFKTLIHDSKYDIQDNVAKMYISLKQINFNFIEDVKTNYKKCLISIMYNTKKISLTIYENSTLLSKSLQAKSSKSPKPLSKPKSPKLQQAKSPPKPLSKPKSPKLQQTKSPKPKSPQTKSPKQKSPQTKSPKPKSPKSLQAKSDIISTATKKSNIKPTKIDYTDYHNAFEIDLNKYKELNVDITKPFFVLVGCNPNDKDAIEKFLNENYKQLMTSLKGTKVMNGKIYFAFQPVNKVYFLTLKFQQIGITVYHKYFKMCNKNDSKATQINPKSGKNEYTCNFNTGKWVKVGGETHKWVINTYKKESPKPIAPMTTQDIPDYLMTSMFYTPNDGYSPDPVAIAKKIGGKYKTSVVSNNIVGATFKIEGLDGNVSSFINQLKTNSQIKEIKSYKNDKSKLYYIKEPKNYTEKIVIKYKSPNQSPKESNDVQDYIQSTSKEFGYKSNMSITKDTIDVITSHINYNWEYFIFVIKSKFGNAIDEIKFGDKIIYKQGQIDMNEFKNLTTIDAKKQFVLKNFDKMTDSDKCAVALPIMNMYAVDEVIKRSKEIIDLMVKLNSTCNTSLSHLDPRYMNVTVFPKYLQNARDVYFDLNYQILKDAFLYLRYVTRSDVLETTYRYLFTKYPNSPFLQIGWNYMTKSRFEEEFNPFIQMKYLDDHKDKVKEGKWELLYKSIPLRFQNTKEYKELEKLVPSLEETEEIKTCMKQYTKPQLVELLVKKFGGTSDNYIHLTHQVLCDMLSKKNLQIIAPEPKTPTIVPTGIYLTNEYKTKFAKQIAYINSLSYETKVALKRYTYQWDWKVNQVLMQPTDNPTSVVHPQYGYNPEQKALPEKMEYGYEHVPYNKISDIYKKIDNAFRNVPPIENDIILYRGVNDKGNTSGMYTLKEDFTKQYWSTSLIKSVSVGFKGGAKCCIFTIKIPKGTHVLPLATLSKYPRENEVLLSRNGDYVITKQDGKGNIDMVFYENKDLYKKQVPTPLYKEYITNLRINMIGPKYVKDIVGNYMGKPSAETNWNYSTWAHVQYSIPKLPYLITNKKLTAEYPGVEFTYYITTNLGKHELLVKDGHVYENNKVIKVQHTKPELAKNPVYVSPPGGTLKVQGIHVNEMNKPTTATTAQKPKTGYSIIKGEYKPGEKQYSKIDVSTVQKANNLKGKIKMHLEKFFPDLQITPLITQKNSEGTYNYAFTIYKPFTNFKELLEQYNKTNPGFAVKLQKKYASLR